MTRTPRLMTTAALLWSFGLCGCPDDSTQPAAGDIGTTDVAADTTPSDTSAKDTTLADAQAGDATAQDTAAPADTTPDSGAVDVTTTDAGAYDSASVDASPTDTGTTDTGTTDTGTTDTGTADVSTTDTGPLPETLTLDPSTLTFFSLPIDSVRFAVSGFDPAAHVCVTLVWDYSNNGQYMGAHCDDFFPGFPYVIIVPSEDGACGAWEYSSDITVDQATGCVDFEEAGPIGVNLIDVEVKVTSATFTGTIFANNRPVLTPPPVTFGIRYTTDVPEDVYVQTANDLGLPDWVRVKKDGAPIILYDRCDNPLCGQSTDVCGIALHSVLNFTNMSYEGQVYLTWDGNIRTINEADGCLETAPAPAGDYTAELCFGWQVEETEYGKDVKSPQCQEIPFTMPAEKVIWDANFGG